MLHQLGEGRAESLGPVQSGSPAGDGRVRDQVAGPVPRQPARRGQLFEERTQLYRKYADLVVKGDGLTQDAVCELIIAELGL